MEPRSGEMDSQGRNDRDVVSVEGGLRIERDPRISNPDLGIARIGLDEPCRSVRAVGNTPPLNVSDIGG